MPGLDVDTSSYPRLPTTQPSFLDVAGKLQGLQQGSQAIQSNAISIQQQQLGLIQSRFKAISGQIPGLLSKPDLNENDIRQFYQNNVKEGLVDNDTAATEIGQIPPTQGIPPAQAALTLKNYLGNKLQMAQSTMEALQYHLGQGGTVDNGASVNPTLSSPKPGFAGNPQAGGVVQPQPGIPINPGPTQPTVSQGAPGQPPMGTPGIMGPSAPPTGLPTVPGAAGRGSILPFSPGTPPPQIVGTGGVPTAGAPTPVKTQSFTATGNSPLFEAGKTQFTQDQQNASQKSQALIPIVQAIPLLKDIMAGPGTDTYTKALAGLKAFGILSTGANDPVAIRQEVAKKLNQYISSNPVGQRSDASQTLAEASSPSPNVQIKPALLKLAQDAVAQDRIQASMPGAFMKADGKTPEDDFSQYGKFKSTYPQTVDPRAFQLDFMPEKERNDLIDSMSKKANSKKASEKFEGNKFFHSLNIVDKQGLINSQGQ